MKNFIYILIIVLIPIISGADLVRGKEKKTPLTKNQKNFAKGTSNDRTYSKAEWLNSYVLALTMSSTYSGLFTESDAKREASIIAAQGYLYTQQNICIKIIDPEYGELAYECSGDQSES